jgi:hypothetical protein
MTDEKPKNWRKKSIALPCSGKIMEKSLNSNALITNSEYLEAWVSLEMSIECSDNKDCQVMRYRKKATDKDVVDSPRLNLSI